MALSLHQSWEAAGHPHPGVGLLHDSQSEVADALLGFFSDPPDAAHLPIDSLFDPPGDCFLHDDAMANPLPCFSAPSAVSLPPGLHAPGDGFDLLHHRPKRPRSCSDLYRPSDLMFEASSCNVAGFPAPELMAELLLAATPPPARGILACDGERKSGAGCLSAQSVAARVRRKRISEKTQELGRLIPGGNKMSTAEMFQAAYKYVKFLQAQVGILGLMGSIKGWKAPKQVEQKLQALLASTAVQEKLSGEGRCIVPEAVIGAMSADRDIESNPPVSRDLDRFVELSRQQLNRDSEN
ncbi:hypothetical protein BHM03_00004611 [Ensete ventricosum]|nr:hypothetical protein BHM03_00004611 [Ensete ventricosum]